MATQSPPKRRLRRFLLARHGETNFNKEHRVQGTSDASVLTSDGQCQAAALGVYIAHRQDGEAKDDGDASAAAAAAPSIARTWCSPLGRCRQTYDAVSNACSSNKDNPLPTPTIHSDLREIELCEWQGRLRREIMVEDTENWHVFKTDPKMLRLKNGTFPPVVDCWERGAKNWEAIRSDAAENNNDANNNSSEEGGATFIMAHGAIGQCMLLHAIGLPIQNYGKSGIRYMFDNCECVEMEWADGEEHCVRWRWAHISRALKEGGQKKSMWVESAASRGMDGGGGLSCGR